jgi:hemolysin III
MTTMTTHPSPVKPRLRGLLHQYAFFASLPALVLLLLASRTDRAALAGTVYGLSLVALFGVSALFHRVTWSPRARRWMARLDHAMINVLIAGTFTPIGLLVLSGRLATASMAIVWGGALANILLHVFWIDAPRWVSAAIYVIVGWSGIAAMPQVLSQVGLGPTVVLGLGGAFYSAGAVVYALRRPDPVPAVFGYHEVFHALVVVAAVSHYAVVALYVLPRV